MTKQVMYTALNVHLENQKEVMILDAKQIVIMTERKKIGFMTIDEAEKIKNVVENKDYLVQLVNAVANVILKGFENLTIEDINMYKLGYNKAIDDFAKNLICELKSRHTDIPIIDIFGSRENWKNKNLQYLECENLIYKIAEQLKEGV